MEKSQQEQSVSSTKTPLTKYSTSRKSPPTQLCTMTLSELDKCSDSKKLLYLYPKLRKMNADMDELKRMVHDLQKFMDKTCFVKVQQDHDTSKNGLSEDIESTSCFSKNKGSKASKENVKATKSKTGFKDFFASKGKSSKLSKSKEKLETVQNFNSDSHEEIDEHQ